MLSKKELIGQNFNMYFQIIVLLIRIGIHVFDLFSRRHF